jgi:hypothetical protein
VTKKRNFNIVDAVVLVAATAGGIGLGRTVDDLASTPDGRLPAIGRQLLAERIHTSCAYLACLLFAWGLALLLLRVRKPRPRLRRLWRSPGAAACLTASVVVAVKLLESAAMCLVWSVLERDEIPTAWILGIQTLPNQQAGAAILATWLVLIVSRAMRLTRDWLEVFGLLVASGWLLLLFDRLVFFGVVWTR